jgi:hypothetical protein
MGREQLLGGLPPRQPLAVVRTASPVLSRVQVSRMRDLMILIQLHSWPVLLRYRHFGRRGL